jgi:hypothetical protein
MSISNQGANSLAGALRRERKHGQSPVLSNIESGIYIAITTGEPDPEGRGRVSAYVPKLGGTPEEPMYFQYAAPFGGSNSGGSYGMFAAPSDAGVSIMVFFADNGELSRGYWFAVAQEVPDVVAGGASGQAQADGTGQGEGAYSDVPSAKSTPASVQERNENSEDELENSDRNVNVAQQGIYADSVRGQSTASPQRDASYENPQHAKVFGMKTPGNNALTMDDGSVAPDGTVHPNQIRLQTGSGASIILDGTNDTIYMINSSGSGWVEIGATGEIMAYAQGSISMRAEKDFNIRADKNINMEAGENVHIKTGNDYHLNTADQIHLKSGGSQFYDSAGSNHTKVGSNMYVSTGSLLHLNGPQAAQSPGMTTVSHADIQNLESTQLDDSILSSMPSHEPMTRNNAPPSAGAQPGSSASEIAPDPNSAEEQLDVADIEDVIDDGEGGSLEYRNQGATRRLKVVPALERILLSAANATNLHVVIFSGGQDHTTGTVGSNRHDHGYAADVWLYEGRGGRRISMTRDTTIAAQFAQAAKSAGALSIGAGAGYMDGVGMHIDISPGATIPISSARYWGTGSRAAGAPSWLRTIMV